MRIAFDKLGTTPRPITLKRDSVQMKGSLRRSDTHRIDLDGRLLGEMTLTCDRCGETYRRTLDEPLQLCVTDRVAEANEDLDIIEFFDGVVDLTYILESEINALEGDYHLCSACLETDETLNIEL